jgi:saccharopine dehydrogenase-like NADP-dependent oxidoreductase
MKILLLGGGAVGYVISKYLLEDNAVSEIICGDIDISRARKAMPPNDKITFKRVDISKADDVAKLAKDTDLIINAANYKFNLPVMKAAIKSGNNYLDLASHQNISPFKAEQLFMHRKFVKAKITGLINAGIAPGVSNLMARELADEFDSADEIKIMLAELEKTNRPVSFWSPETYVEECGAKVPVLENGKFKLKEPLSDCEAYDFPYPIGKLNSCLVCQDEQITLPYFIKTKSVCVKNGGGDIGLFKELMRLGLFSDKPVRINNSQIIPKEFLLKLIPRTPSPKEMLRLIRDGVIEECRFSIVVEIRGRQNGGNKIKKICMISEPFKKITERMPGTTYISYITGVAAGIFAKNMDRINEYGVFPTEYFNTDARSRIFKELKRNGIAVKKL